MATAHLTTDRSETVVVGSARLHVGRLYPLQLPLFEQVLERLDYPEIADPASDRVALRRGLCRDESDGPVVLVVADARVDDLVTNDRDPTATDESTATLRELVNVITPLALLRHVLGWPEGRTEAVIHRNWHELPSDDPAAEPQAERQRRRGTVNSRDWGRGYE